MATYPAAIPTFTNPTSTQKLGESVPAHATQHTTLNNEVGAALAIIGTNPQGTGATLVARLSTADGLITAASSQAGVALSTATAALTLAGVATSNAGTALSTAQAAYTTATSAYLVATVATSNAAVALSTATAALSTAQSALSTAQAAIPKSIGSSKGQVIVFTASGTPIALAASADGTALVCDATSASGFKFGAVSGSGASATHFLIGATSPTTSGDVIVAITTITSPFAVVVNMYNPSGTMVIPDSIIATATQFTVNLASYLSTGTLSGTYGGVYII